MTPSFMHSDFPISFRDQTPDVWVQTSDFRLLTSALIPAEKCRLRRRYFLFIFLPHRYLHIFLVWVFAALKAVYYLCKGIYSLAPAFELFGFYPSWNTTALVGFKSYILPFQFRTPVKTGCIWSYYGFNHLKKNVAYEKNNALAPRRKRKSCITGNWFLMFYYAVVVPVLVRVIARK